MEANAARLLRDLTPEQRVAVTNDSPRLVIEAGPGSGKTRVITRRIGYRIKAGTNEASHVLALTFTRAAGLELRDRLERLGVKGTTTGSFHSVGLSLLWQRYADGLGREPTVVKSRERMCRYVLSGAGDTRVSPRTLDTEIGWANSRLLTASTYAEHASAERRPLPVAADLMAGLIGGYQRLKAQRGVLDFDDLLISTFRALRDEPEWQAATQWRFRHLYTDEYQDTSELQFRILQGLCGPDSDICVVGDPHQSIFAFAGAQPNSFERFREHFTGSTTFHLATNHRSSRPIVIAANHLIPAEMCSVDDSRTGEVSILDFNTPDEEALGIAKALLTAGPPWSRMAVLGRTYATLNRVEAACQLVGVPTTRPRNLLQQPEIKMVLRELESVPTHTPAPSLRSELITIASDIGARLAGDTDSHAEAEIVESLQDRLVQHHMSELLDLHSDFITSMPTGNTAQFLSWLEAAADEILATRPATGAVELRTIHRAKGLEWDDIFIVGCNDRQLPLPNASPEEERRLMFVAMTRARDRLTCTWARSAPDRRGQIVRQDPSPYLDCLRAGIAASIVPRADSVLVSQTLNEARRQLAQPSSRTPRPISARRFSAAALLRTSEAARKGRGSVEEAILTALASELGIDRDRLQEGCLTNAAIRSEVRTVLALCSHEGSPGNVT